VTQPSGDFASARPQPSQPVQQSQPAVTQANAETKDKIPTPPASANGGTAASGSFGQQAPPVNNLGGSAAVALQVQESQTAQASTKPRQLEGLSDEEKAEVQRLKERDREVRAHENAHATVGGGYTGAPSFDYARGPDGVQYAVGGHVDIDVSEVPNDPQATIAKLEAVRSAALAPARPSGQDRAVAAAAAAKSREAEAQLAKVEKEAVAEALSAKDSDNTAPSSAAIQVSSGTDKPPQSLPPGLVTGVNPEPQGLVGIDLLV